MRLVAGKRHLVIRAGLSVKYQPSRFTATLPGALQPGMRSFSANGVGFANSSQLVGSGNYVKFLGTVANETYPTDYTMGVTITVTGIAGVRTSPSAM